MHKELWILLSLFTICLILNLVVDGQRMVLSFYTLPTLGAASLYGRRQGTLTALGSVLLVCLMTWYNPILFASSANVRMPGGRWLDMQQHVSKGVAILEPVGGSLRRVIPIVLAHHDKFDASGYHPTGGEDIPLEARIISVADVYDSLTSDRPYPKAMSLFEARDVIAKGSGTDFDPRVVDAFMDAFRRGELEVPAVVV